MRRLTLLPLVLLLLGCGSDSEPSASGGGGGATTSCVATSGTLSGDALIPGSAIGGADQAADNAILNLTPSGGDTIQAMADAAGHFEVELEAGTWTVSAEHTDQCFTAAAQSVTISACATTQLDLELSDCFD
jgi:hypothetical protein